MDVLEFLERHGITYDPNRTYRDNVYVRCPWCEDEDESAHMGIRLDGEKYGCWRDERHRGSDIRTLVQRLLRCSWDEAEALVRNDRPAANAAWDDLRQRLEASEIAVSSTIDEPAEYPDGIVSLADGRRTSAFRRYLTGRGFLRRDVPKLIEQYALAGGLFGRWRNRLVIPFIEEGTKYGWTGRAIGPARIRYLTEPSGTGSKRFVMNHDGAAEGGSVLVLVEGPLDCLKLDYYGQTYGVRAVPLLGTSLTDAQADKIAALADRFDRVALLLDAGTGGVALRLTRRYAVLRPRTVSLPDGFGDPGDLTPLAARRFARELTRS